VQEFIEVYTHERRLPHALDLGYLVGDAEWSPSLDQLGLRDAEHLTQMFRNALVVPCHDRTDTQVVKVPLG